MPSPGARQLYEYMIESSGGGHFYGGLGLVLVLGPGPWSWSWSRPAVGGCVWIHFVLINTTCPCACLARALIDIA